MARVLPPDSNKHRVGDIQNSRSLMEELGLIAPDAPKDETSTFSMNFNQFIKILNRDLESEGLSFMIDKDTQLAGGFTRVFITRQGEVHPASFLDLQIGGHTPGGPAIRMQVTKENTYAIPGFTRLIGNNVTNTISTFEDFVRAYHANADKDKVSPQATIWTTYQEGSEEYHLPGSGAVVTPSSSTGKVSYEEKIVRYIVPQDEPGNTPAEKERNYQRRIGGIIGSHTGLPQLAGYVPEVNQQKVLVPGSNFYWTTTDKDTGAPVTMVEVLRGANSEFKSLSTVREARQLANVPLIRDPQTGRLQRVTASSFRRGLSNKEITAGGGIRSGWTKSSVILPGETAPREVLVQSLMLADTPDMPGAAYASPSAFRVASPTGEGGEYLYSIGEQMNSIAELGITNVDQLMSTLQGLNIQDVEGRTVRSGKGRQKVGTMIDATGKEVPILIDRRGYDTALGRPVLHIPQFFDKATRTFSNIPTDSTVSSSQIIDTLRKQVGIRADIVNTSSIGIGDIENPAEVYISIPTIGMNPVALKTSGMKAFTTPTEQLSVSLRGIGDTDIDLMSQEAKIPTRTLMSSFGIMNPQVQARFLRRFAGGDKKRIEETISWMRHQYSRKNFRGIDLEEMADVFNTVAGDLPPEEFFTADIMFANMFRRILDTKGKKNVKELWNVFGIGLPVENQMMRTTTYSQSEMEYFQDMLNEQPGLVGKVTFEEVPSDAPWKPKRYRMRQQVQPGSIVLHVGASYTPEYQSQSGYVNPKSIMALSENFPNIASAIGLTSVTQLGGKDVPIFSGPNMVGKPSAAHIVESREAWTNLWTWAGFQTDLNQGIANIPANTLEITPSLAFELQDAVTEAGRGKNSRERLELFRKRLRDIVKDNPDFSPDTNLEDVFLVEPSTGTLLPKLSSILGAESYRSGYREGETRTFIGDSYLRLVVAAAQAAVTERGGSNFQRVLETRNRFYNRIAHEFLGEPGSKTSRKKIYRNIYGVELPGSRGGRYMALPGLDTVDAVADANYIQAMLTNGGFQKSGEAQKILKWLDSADNAYLPIMVQRFPDVSGQRTWMPVRLRSAKWYRDHGGKMPEHAGTMGVFYMSQTLNRYFIGDFDADPAMAKIIPITQDPWDDPRGPKTYGWHITTKEGQEEFDQGIHDYEHVGRVVASLNPALSGMMGPRGTKAGSDSLDAARKNLADYAAAVAAGEGGSLKKRLGAVGVTTMRELMTAAMKVKHFKTGMGVAYNRRTLTEDIMEMVLAHGGLSSDEQKVHNLAYESGAFSYQAYLDREAIVQGDFNPLETLFNTITLTRYQPRDKWQGVQYSVKFKTSEQGREIDYGAPYNIEEENALQRDKHLWGDDLVWGGQDPGTNPNFLLKSMLRRVSADENIGNALLSWGFSNIGSAAETFDMLGNVTDPKKRNKILLKALEAGKVGVNSPFYMAALFSLVRRIREKQPGVIQDEDVKLPWIDGKYRSLKYIEDSPEFQQADVLRKLFIENNLVAGADELRALDSMGATRLARHALGILEEWKWNTGGNLPTTPAQQALMAKLERLPTAIKKHIQESVPIIHASELGGLYPSRNTEWGRTRDDIAASLRYSAVMRWMGLPEVFGDREQKGSIFSRVGFLHIGEDINAPTDIEKGNLYEAEYARQHPEIHHIGAVKREAGDYSLISRSNLTFNVGGLTITGVPDFVDYDEKSGKVIIVDTKLARQDPAGNEAIRTRVASYKNRMQQVGYAYGLEQLANGPEEEWNALMRRWGFKDAKKIKEMRRAAAQGMFDISLAPGSVAPVGLRTYAPVPIPYNPTVRREYERAAEFIYENVFSEKSVTGIAEDVYGSLSREGGYPVGIQGTIARNASYVIPRNVVQTLKMFVKNQRAAFGGRYGLDGEEHIRVGEAGPEDILIKDGEVSIIPESESPEGRLAKGKSSPIEGFYGARMATGKGRKKKPTESEASNPGFITPDEPEIPASTAVSRTPEARKPAFETSAEAIAALGRAVSEAIGQRLDNFSPNITVRTQFGMAAPKEDMEIERKLRLAIQTAKRFSEQALPFNREVSRTMEQIFEREGKTDLIQDIRGNASDLILRAQESLPEEAYMPSLAPLLKKARGIATLGKAHTAIYSWIKSVGEGDRAKDIIGGLPAGIQEQLASMPGMSEGNELNPSVEQGGYAAASIVELGRTEPLMKPGKFSGASQEAVDEFIDSVGRLTKSTRELESAQGDLTKTNKVLSRTKLEEIDSEIKETTALREDAARRASRLFNPKTGDVYTTAERKALGLEVSDSELDALRQYQNLSDKLIGLREQRTKYEGAGFGRGISSLARSFLGGWGLMYVGTLAGMGTQALSEGYQQYEQTEAARYTAAARYYPGVGVGTRAEQQIQSALAAGGTIPYRQWRMDTAYMQSAGMGDIGGAFQKGLGAGALSLFVGNLLSEAGTTANLGGMQAAGSMLSKGWWLPAALMTVGTLGYEQYSYAMNPIDTGIAVASGKRRAAQEFERGNVLGGVFESVGAWWKNISSQNIPLGMNYEAGPPINSTGFTRVTNSEGITQGYYKESTGEIVAANQLTVAQREEADAGIAYTTSFNVGQLDMASAEYQKTASTLLATQIKSGNYQATVPSMTYQKYYSKLADQVLAQKGFAGLPEEAIAPVMGVIGTSDARFDKYTDEVKYKVLAMLGKGQNLDLDLAEKMMSGYTAGYRYDEAAQAMNPLRGAGLPTAKNMSDMISALVGKSDEDIARLEAAANFISQLPEDSLRISVTGDAEAFAAKLEESSKRYENIIGTTKEQPVVQALQAAQFASAMGINVSSLTGQIGQILGMRKEQNLSPEQLLQLETEVTYVNQERNRWQQVQMDMRSRGISPGQAREFTSALAPYGLRGQSFAQGILSGNPAYYSFLTTRGIDLSRLQAANIFGQQANLNDLAVSDINLSGEVTGLPLYTTSLRQGNISSLANATRIFGEGWQTRDTYGYGMGMAEGQVVPGYEQFGKVGGLRYLQLESARLSAAYQQQTAGINFAQIALGKAFQTGVGIGNYNPINPQTGTPFNFNTGAFTVSVPGFNSYTTQGGGFWGIEEAQRALQNMQAQYGFQMSQRQMEMQTNQFMQSNALQRQGTLMQRGWTAEDWAYQSQTRGLQWGWRLEDFQEQSRFMTGRDRRLAERQMGRETIMHNLEEEQISKNIDRQKESWQLQDEQYELQIRQFQETKALQEEANMMNQEFYEEQRKLMEQSAEMQHAYWMEQQKLQAASAGAAAAYAARMADLNKRQMETSLSAQDATTKAGLLSSALTDLSEILKILIDYINDNPTDLGLGTESTPSEYNEGGSAGNGYIWHWDPDQKKWVKIRANYAVGGYVFKDTANIVNDTNQPEFFSPNESGMVIPLSNLNPWLSTMTTSKTASQDHSSTPARVSIYIGNQFLTEFILDAVDKEIHL